MTQKIDNLHYNTRVIDGYNKPFNFIISSREAGKSTAIWLKIYKAFKTDKRPSLVIRRLIADITEVYINSIESILRKFCDESINFEYKHNFKEGAIDIKIDGVLFFRVIALSNPLNRIKSLVLLNIKYIIFDEFIINTREGEKYLYNEPFKFEELYNTFQRESPDIKTYFLGNPYSCYSPYFMRFGFATCDLINETGVLKHPNIIAHDEAIIECYDLKPELKKYILSKNPLYRFDDSYTKYALEGININDQNIKIGERPDGYKLKFIFRVDGNYLGLYQDESVKRGEKERFYCDFIKDFSERRNIYVFEFADLVDKAKITTLSDKIKFLTLKDAIGERNILFSSIECYYLIEELYKKL